MKKENVEPLFHSDLKKISPPNSLIISLQICNPKPTPFVLSSFVVSKKPNNLNNLF
jgi:hypothetical protein